MYLHNYFTTAATGKIFEIDMDVVDVLISETLSNPMKEDLTIEKFLAPFTPVLELKNDETVIAGYTAHVHNPLQYNLVVDYLSTGLLFCQSNLIFQTTKKCTGLVSIGSLGG